MNQAHQPDQGWKRIVVGVVFGLALYCAIMVALCMRSTFPTTQWFAQIEDGLSKVPLLPVEGLVIVFLSILPHLLLGVDMMRHPDRALVQYPDLTGLAIQLSSNIGTILLLYSVALRQPEGLASLGIQLRGVDLWTVFLVGVMMFIGLAAVGFLVYALVLKIKPGQTIPDPYHQVILQQQTVWERIAYLPVLVCGVLSEELVYRGYLVQLLGQRTDVPIVFAIVSILLSIVVHLYQGRLWIVFHLLFSAALVVSVLLTGNIWTAVCVHLLWNIRSTLNIWFGGKKVRQEEAPSTS